MKPTRCRSCHRPVVWGVLANGKKMPIDPEPLRFGGNVEVFDEDEDPPRIVILRKGDPRPEGLLYRSHFASCPNAARHRKASPGSA